MQRAAAEIPRIPRRVTDAAGSPDNAFVRIVHVAAAALGLTRTESRVALLLAEGKTVREVAAATGRRCQTNWIGPIEASIEGSQAASWRHSARAAVRCCLKTSRRVRWRWWLKWLWIEAWTAANFCRVLMSLNRAIAPSRLRNG